MSNYLIHDLTTDEVNKTLRLIQNDISHIKSSKTTTAPTQTVLGNTSVASLLATTPSGTGTVTSVSVFTANGFQGTVATPTTTASITLQTSLSAGIIKSNGSNALVLAVAGTDYQAPLTFPLAVILGGTGEATAFTQGSVVFAGASGIYTQDNANFFYNPLGYGGDPNLEIGPRGSNPTDASFEFYVVSGVTAHFHNTNPTQSITGGVTVGLMYVPTGAAVTSGNRVGSLEFGGSFNTSNSVGTGAAIRCYPTQNYTSTTLGTQMVFQTVPNGSATLATVLTLGQDKSATFVGLIDIATVGQGLQVAEGSNAKQGVATLSLGTVTVANTSVTATSRVFLSRQGLNASTTLGELAVNSRIAGTSFTITAYNPTTALVSVGDLSTVAYEIFEQG